MHRGALRKVCPTALKTLFLGRGAHVTKGLEMRIGSSSERNSTVPMAEDGSMGVNTK